jgi:hypothetical protein
MKRKTERKMKRIVFKNLNGISKASKEIAKEWGVMTIPLSTLKVIIDKSKPSKTNDKALDEFIIQYNKTLDSLYKGCCDIAAKMNSKNIPLSQINNGLAIIKNAF